MTRQEWLDRALAVLVSILRPQLPTLPPTVAARDSWTSTGARGSSLSEVTRTPDGAHAVLTITPRVADARLAVAIMAHDLIHAATGPRHGAPYRAAQRAAGLEGKPATCVPSPALWERLADVLEELGPLPMSALALAPRALKKGAPRNGIILVCPRCGYRARVAAHWYALGAPLCPTDWVALEVIA